MVDTYYQDTINVSDAHQNNLKHVNVKLPKHEITVFVGESGSGKSSLVFDTIAAMSRRELNETFPSFSQQYLPKYGQPHVGDIKNLPVAIAIEQKQLTGNARSTLATYTGIYSLLRLLFSRVGKPFVGYSEVFSFNLPQGMCPYCQGLGYVDEVDESKLIDPEKSLNNGAITFVSFGPGTWRWRGYGYSGLFDNDKPIKDYTPEEYDLLMHAPQQKLYNAPAYYKTSQYEGVVPRIKRSIINSREGKHHKEAISEIVTREVCPVCKGARLNPRSLSVKINGFNINDVSQMDLVQFLDFLDSIKDNLGDEIIRGLESKIQPLVDIGLGYLTLDRTTSTLSGGEVQRIKIANHLTNSLSDILYVFDEPSVGLHPHDIALIKKAMINLKKKGNTIFIVDHNPEIMSIADHVVEVGPKSGADGGKITFSGTYPEVLDSDTLTGKWLRAPHHFAKPLKPKGFVDLEHVHMHNIDDVSVKVPTGIMTVLSGVAGSGKSSLAEAMKDRLNGDYVDLTQKQAGISIRSTPVTYLNILNPIRKLFAKANNVSTQLFSYNGKGACPRCKGKGVTITNMAFMDPVVQTCELCHGKRYSQEALSYKYHGKDIADVLSMSVAQAATFFKDVPEIANPLKQMNEVGLDYLALNQALTTLSGGELQRLRLAQMLEEKGKIYFLDEPTAGLHMNDTQRLLKLFKRMVADGDSLIIVEHNLDVISQADWLIDMGPGAGIYGGNVLYSGIPEGSEKVPQSFTGRALKKYMLPYKER
ncbi:ATP-binding cassette domain-containing protein [Fructilactobacillus fructivorans]|uniref:UvrABC system protein A n=1 Tax=Fructilactobacillus fructivorans TaxID=1614 RepID=A0AAE6P1R3_9LACO|nr:excinuclease ABC subunit UvrA [Fructilactobacillus fructivorans]KRK57499.1 excinuclease ATPase subunit [Fructilactobacillus fructivorans]KRN12351.1 excinuclease ATPase subunit [Fructilactobacillus fructivorans]KRN39905.1 excinuclease ATPase subunit [Fructilactobacillus fructivorans]KRN42389.1 excinuclease ATPase subunit [Fructilactobacillus fructivorans]QFX93174.1 ATP-binding cassette domain-containing protein [Fructilactobacillus fructivorans]